MSKDASIEDTYKKLTTTTGYKITTVYGILNSKRYEFEKNNLLSNIEDGVQICAKVNNDNRSHNFMSVAYQSDSDNFLFDFLTISGEIFKHTKERLMISVGINNTTSSLFTYEFLSPTLTTVIEEDDFQLSEQISIPSLIRMRYKNPNQ